MTVICEICGEELKDTRGLFGHKRLKHPETVTENGKSEGKAAVINRPQPLDAVIRDLAIPAVPDEYDGTYNVYVEGFNAGVMHGAKSILAGIRAAQELSAIGVQQATPVIKMAQEMRLAEGQAAEQLAAQMVKTISQGNNAVIDAINNLPKGDGPAVNPMAELMKPYLGKIIGHFMAATFKTLPGMGAVTAGAAPPGQPPAGQPGAEPQSDGFGDLPGNINKRSLQDLEEEAENV